MELYDDAVSLFNETVQKPNTGGNSSTNTGGNSSTNKLPTCYLGHQLHKKISYNGGCCDVRHGTSICSTMWDINEEAEVMECLICNHWDCMPCYNKLLNELASQEKKSTQMACENYEFSPIMIIATILSFNAWFKAKNILFDKCGWIFADKVPEVMKSYIGEYIEQSALIDTLLAEKKMKITVDTNIDNIQRKATSYERTFAVDRNTIEKVQKDNGGKTLCALVNLNILVKYWDDNIDMKKMYEDHVEILTLSTKNKYVCMGNDPFYNIWVRYEIPELPGYTVMITHLKGDYNYYSLLEAYKNINLTDEDSQFKLNEEYKGVRFLPLMKEVTNTCMRPILGAQNGNFTCVGTQVKGHFGVSGKTMLSLSITALTIGTLRSCSSKRKDLEGFVDFFDEEKNTNCLYTVYKGNDVLYSAVLNEKNYSDR